MVNYQKYIDEILDLILENDINNIRIKEISKEINEQSGINGLLILYEILSNNIGRDYLGCLYEIELELERELGVLV